MDIFKKQFGPLLKQAIRVAGFTQAEFAELVGVETSSVSRWCNSIDFPHDDRMPGIHRILKLPEGYFLGGSKVVLGVEIDEIIELLQLWKSASDSDKKTVLNVLREKQKYDLNKSKKA